MATMWLVGVAQAVTHRATPSLSNPQAPSLSRARLYMSEDFTRSSDLLGTGDKVSAAQVANVLGRWKTRSDWNDAGMGRKGLIDDYRNGDYYEEDLPQLKTDFSKPMQYYIARRPQFMDFCERYGLVAVSALHSYGIACYHTLHLRHCRSSLASLCAALGAP